MAKRTIKLKSYLDIHNEFLAGGVLKPGHLLSLASTGKVVVHAVAGGNALTLFGLEDAYRGKTIEDAFAVDDPVQVWTATRGDEVYAILKDGENVAIGDPLESAGDGTLQKHVADIDSASDVTTIYGNQIVGYALEALNMSGSTGADPSPRIKIVIA